MSSNRSFASRTRSICRSSSSAETSFPNPCVAEWSVNAMYSYPRARAAAAIWSIVLRPSEATVWQWSSPRMSSSAINRGSFPCRAACSSPRSSRSSGSTYAMPSSS